MWADVALKYGLLAHEAKTEQLRHAGNYWLWMLGLCSMRSDVNFRLFWYFVCVLKAISWGFRALRVIFLFRGVSWLQGDYLDLCCVLALLFSLALTIRKRVEFYWSVKMRVFGSRSWPDFSLEIILPSFYLLISHAKLVWCLFFLLWKRVLDIVDFIDEMNVLHDFFVVKSNDLRAIKWGRR